MQKTEEFMAKWLVLSVVMCYCMIYKYGKIGFVELTGTLIGTLIGVALWELIKFVAKRK